MMIEVINSHHQERLTEKLKRIRERNVALDGDLMSQVGSIIDDVRRRGDAALIDYAAQFDNCVMQASELRISEEELRHIASNVDTKLPEALSEAIRNVRRFHEHEQQHSWEIETEYGVRLGQSIRPIERVGLYVPGGTASYPSSVVMNVVPAQVAGVQRIVVATPPRSLRESPAVAAALLQLGVTEVYAVGGAQAIAALAYGTGTVPRVDVVEKSLAQYGVILIVADLDEACSLVNELAPEHLEIVTRDNDAVAARILHAGAIFFGPYTPEVVGDYFAGPNHVLPTAGAARFSSALGVHDFVKRTSVLRYSREALTHSAE